MSKAHTSGASIGARVGSGDVAAGAARFLSFAATPTFMFMALWIGMFNDHRDMLCMPMHDASPFSGMVVMYALMSIFHMAPWLKLISSRRMGVRRS
jgi:hypothetical protein